MMESLTNEIYEEGLKVINEVRPGVCWNLNHYELWDENASSSRIQVYKLGSDSVKFVLTVKRLSMVSIKITIQKSTLILHLVTFHVFSHLCTQVAF